MGYVASVGSPVGSGHSHRRSPMEAPCGSTMRERAMKAMTLIGTERADAPRPMGEVRVRVAFAAVLLALCGQPATGLAGAFVTCASHCDVQCYRGETQSVNAMCRQDCVARCFSSSNGGGRPAGPSATWGAIYTALPPATEYGYSFRARSQQEAEAIANRECFEAVNTLCEPVAIYRNSCAALVGAFVDGTLTRWTSEVDARKSRAEARALAHCQDTEPNASCEVEFTTCSTDTR